MTIIRNQTELRIHNRMTDAVWRDNAQAAAQARDDHARKLEQWRKLEREQPEACEYFDAYLGDPPLDEGVEGWEAARLGASSCECPYPEDVDSLSREKWIHGWKTFGDIWRRRY